MDLAIVGIGDWGRNLVRTFDSVATVRACVHTGDPDNERWLADHYPDVDLTTDYDAVLADPGIDAVAIATPIPALADAAERALRADKHVYVEKPMAATLEGAERLAALADERDRRLFVGYIFVHHPVVARLRERLDGRDPDYLRLEWNYVGTFGPDLVVNLACHPASIAVDLLGDPDDVAVTTNEAVTGSTDVLDAALSYGDARADLRVNRLSPLETNTSGTVVAGDDAYFFDDDRLARFDHDAGAFGTVHERDAEPLATECRAFVECVEAGRRPRTDGAFGVRVHRVLDALAG